MRRDLHIGWARAALRQRDVAWARALLRGGAVLDEPEAPADLLAVLPPGERDTAAADLIRWVEGQPDLLRVLERVPGPWTGALAEAVVAILEIAAGGRTRASRSGDRGSPRHEHILTQLCRLADQRLSPDTAPRLQALAPSGDTTAGRALTDLIETLTFRADMLKELAP